MSSELPKSSGVCPSCNTVTGSHSACRDWDEYFYKANEEAYKGSINREKAFSVPEQMNSTVLNLRMLSMELNLTAPALLLGHKRHFDPAHKAQPKGKPCDTDTVPGELLARHKDGQWQSRLADPAPGTVSSETPLGPGVASWSAQC